MTDGYKIKRIYIGDKLCWPKWTPGANTIAYYPLTSTTTVNDMSGNNHTLTATGTTTYDSLGVYIPMGASYLTCSDSAVSQIPSTYTVCCWVKRYSSSTKPCFGVTTPNGASRGYNLSWNEASGRYRIEILSTGGTSANSYTGGDDNRHLWTMSLTGGTGTFYLDTTPICTATTSNSYSQTMVFMINKLWDNTNKGGGYYSEFIIENKVRTADEVAKYYDLTKGNYGL